MHPALASAAATLDDYLDDFQARAVQCVPFSVVLAAPLAARELGCAHAQVFLLPRVYEALLLECAKRAAVTYAALLLTGPPLSLPSGIDDDAVAAGTATSLLDAARFCIRRAAHATHTHDIPRQRLRFRTFAATTSTRCGCAWRRAACRAARWRG